MFRSGVLLVSCSLFGLLGFVGGCKLASPFSCGADTECVSQEGNGVCQPSTGFCSFADTSCPSGHRYGEHAGMGHARKCVPLEAGDAGAVDAMLGEDGRAADAFPADSAVSDGSVADRAVPDAPPDAAPPDAAPPDAAPPTPCGKTGLLADDFADGVRHPDWKEYARSAATVAETGGRLVVTIANGIAGPNYSGYTSELVYDLRGDHVRVEVPAVGNTATQAEVYLAVMAQNRDALVILESAGTLNFLYRVGADYSNVGSIAYNASDHRYWRIRESSGTAFWETSSDQVTWTIRASLATPFPVDQVRVDLAAGTYRPEANPGAAAFDNLNGGTPVGRYCSASSMKDDFDDGVIAPAWDRSYVGPGCVQRESGGVAVLVPGTTGRNYCAFQSAKAHDMRGDSTWVKVPRMVNTASQAQAFFQVVDPSGAIAAMVQVGGELQVKVGKDYSVIGRVPYDAGTMLWWRIRESGGTTFFETSPSGSSWTTRLSTPNPFDMSKVSLQLGSGAELPMGAAGEVNYDNLNLPP
ncbi:MAG: hypothetical protein HY698_12895 [Deltaproteobacteria bacterium]|nr:hypothetical protein [Deltaproteobacteria bacterium]